MNNGNGQANGNLDEVENDVLVFLQEQVTPVRSDEVKEEMTGLGYGEEQAADALHRLRKKGRVRRLTDEDGKPMNKYKAVTMSDDSSESAERKYRRGEEVRICHKKGRIGEFHENGENPPLYDVEVEIGGVIQHVTVNESFLEDQKGGHDE